MRIGLDARSVGLEGVGRYIRELTANLAEIDDKNEYILYFLSEKDAEKHTVKKSNFSSALLPISLYDIHKQPLLTRRLRKDGLDVFHATDHWLAPLFPPCKLIITIHDLYAYYLPEVVSTRALAYGRFLFNRTFKKAVRLILTTNFMKCQLLKHQPGTEKKITLVPLGVSKAFKSNNGVTVEEVRKKFGIEKNYLLYVGTLRNYKNVARLIEAFGSLPLRIRDSHNLVIAADKKTRFADILKKPKDLGIETEVKFVGLVQTEDLSALYRGATAFVLPALCEWFGLPIIEAMSSGVPVITSNVTSMPEVAGGAAVLVDPYCIDELRKAMENVIVDEALRLKLIHLGKERSAIFSWAETANKVLNVYHEQCG